MRASSSAGFAAVLALAVGTGGGAVAAATGVAGVVRVATIVAGGALVGSGGLIPSGRAQPARMRNASMNGQRRTIRILLLSRIVAYLAAVAGRPARWPESVLLARLLQ